MKVTSGHRKIQLTTNRWIPKNVFKMSITDRNTGSCIFSPNELPNSLKTYLQKLYKPFRGRISSEISTTTNIRRTLPEAGFTRLVHLKFAATKPFNVCQVYKDDFHAKVEVNVSHHLFKYIPDFWFRVM